MLNNITLSVLFAGFVARHVVAQDQEIEFDIYSSKDCGEDQSKVFTEKHNTLSTVQTTADTESCAATTIDWGDWPQANGKYTSFADTSSIEDDCQLIFYTAAPLDDDGADSSQCFIPYRSLNSNSGCASVSIPMKFGLVYCCGNGDCQPTLPATQKRDSSGAKLIWDVTKSKRAPILQRFNSVFNQKRDSKCTFDKTSDVMTQYLFPAKSSDEVKCPPDADFDCQVSGDYSTGTSISQSSTKGYTVGASAGFFGIGASFGYDTSVTNEAGSSTSFSRSYTLSIPPGSSGYLIFTAKQLCGKGTFNGDECDDALKVGEEEWCIPALIPGQNGTEPDGDWSILETN
ncbi:hypothetical protein F4678DRAFT_485505 [Xylaria arbuscula]|nr:hypothetical protein F4678DRAFT_485505 [Xylaria arbuscula]